MATEFDITKHSLTPKHSKLTKAEAEKLLKEKKFRKNNLPKIFMDDPAIQHLKPELGEIIQIERNSPTAGKTYFYRVVSNA